MGGTNHAVANLVLSEEPFIGGSTYDLSGGALITGNTAIYGSESGAFLQRGGTHSVTGTLALHPHASAYYTVTEERRVRYHLQGGQLSAQEIRVGSNCVFRHTGGTISGLPTLMLAGGTLESAAGHHEFGSLKLVASTQDSTLSLPGSTATVRFVHVPPFTFYWDAWARLVIHNWRGSAAGGGTHQVVFGTNASGVTPPQLAKIRFRNPAGFPAGDYAATLLDTGEVVPLDSPRSTDRGPAITFSKVPVNCTWSGPQATPCKPRPTSLARFRT